eukprot:TRINITY_DN251_c8_g1_i1.p1 TRINITY_DN251_c8_g1~~TRINITY_DN251_c8_g1_i1.p1  ORF type:complete len:267 (+),score=107.20 TRINITY_DN251_c8_g1_i1:83-883(+)
MPGDDSDDERSGAAYTQQKEGSEAEARTRGQSTASSAAAAAPAKEPDAGSEDERQPMRRDEEDSDDDIRGRGPPPAAASAGGGAWSKKLNFLIIGTLGVSLLCLIIITATRSWGVGKVLKHDISAGLFTICGNYVTGGGDYCKSWGDICPDAEGNISGSAAFAIMSILLLAAMLAVQLLFFFKGTAFVPKLQMVLHHVLWLFLLICWACFAGAKNQMDCDAWHRNFDDTLYYAWGWMFVLWMWLVHLLTAVLVTLKVLGKPLPCNM